MECRAMPMVREYGVDYITMTSQDRESAIEMYEYGCRIISEAYRVGNKVRPIAPNGYKGTQCGYVFVGKTHDQTMLRVSGPSAFNALLSTQMLNVNCTRIDLQVTVQLPEYDGSYGHRQYHDAMRNRNTEKINHQGHLRHILGTGKGDTTMIGSRASVRYGRLYDKEKESGEELYQRCWRYEVEYKAECAQKAFDEIRGSHSKADRVRSFVSGQYSKWGFDIKDLQYTGELIAGAGRPLSDDERSIDWINKQVYPTIVKLLEHGHDNQIKMIIDKAYDEAELRIQRKGSYNELEHCLSMELEGYSGICTE